MKRSHLTLAMLAMVVVAPARAADIYFTQDPVPRINRWGNASPVTVTYNFASSDGDLWLPGPDGTQGSGIDGAAFRSAFNYAAQQWTTSVNCCTDNTSPRNPLLTLSAGASTSPPGGGSTTDCNNPSTCAGWNQWVSTTGGDTGPASVKPIWTARHEYPAPTDFKPPQYAGTLGITMVTPMDPNDGPIQKAFMLFNGFEPNRAGAQVRWYTGNTAPGGCVDNNGCYNFETVAIHELGHFIGYNHDPPVVDASHPANPALAESVMYAAYAGRKRQIMEKDRETVCDNTYGYGYGHTACPNPTPQETQQQDPVNTQTNGGTTPTNSGGNHPVTLYPRYHSCANDNECASFFLCRTFSNGEHACDWPCSSSAVCPTGEVCGASGYCFKPPQSASGGSTSGGTTSTGSSGSTGASGGNTGASGNSNPQVPTDPIPIADFCAPCDSRAGCLSNNCVKFGESATPICTVICNNDDDCGTLGTCTSNGGTGTGFCAPKDPSCIQKAVARRGQINESCSSEAIREAGLVCSFLRNDSVCLEFCAPDGSKPCSTEGYSCLEVDKERRIGVCFKSTAREGESCVIPDTALCGFSGQYQCTGTPEKGLQDAQCYKICSSNAQCAAGQNCVITSTGAGVCNPIKVPDCPLAEYGQKCAKAEDCISGYCINSGSDSACSHTCSVSLQTGCPKDFTCRSTGVGDKGYCWPANNVTKAAPQCIKPGAACGANGGSCKGSNGDIALFVIALSLLWRRRKGKR